MRSITTELRRQGYTDQQIAALHAEAVDEFAAANGALRDNGYMQWLKATWDDTKSYVRREVDGDRVVLARGARTKYKGFVFPARMNFDGRVEFMINQTVTDPEPAPAKEYDYWSRPVKNRGRACSRHIRRWGNRCFYCELSGDDRLGPDGFRWQADHRTPRSAGGTNSRDNIVLCCRTCNAVKKIFDAADYLNWVRSLPLRPAWLVRNLGLPFRHFGPAFREYRKGVAAREGRHSDY